MTLILINANVAGATFVLCGILLIVMNHKYLPPQIRPPLWRNLVLVVMVLFYGFFMIALIAKQACYKFLYSLNPPYPPFI
jgi:hypothetical protein